MPTPASHRQRLNIREEQMEMPSSSNTAVYDEDVDNKLKQAERQLEKLRQEQEELARRKQEVEHLSQQKQDFIAGQIEITEKLSAALTAIDRELYEMRSEMGELEQLRECFARHAKDIEAINPEAWGRDSLPGNLQKALSNLEKAEEDYEQAVEHFSNNGRNSVFGNQRGGNLRPMAASVAGEFATNFRNGLAFNLPLIIAGIAGAIFYLYAR